MMPAWLLRAVPYVAAVGAVLLALAVAYNRGAAHKETEWRAAMAEQQARYSASLAAAERARREVEQAAAADLAAVTEKHLEIERNAKAENDRLRADLRSSRVRLSVPVASCTAAAAGADPAAAAGSGAEARAELDPQAADDLAAIAADGDAAIRQLNAVIDAYNALRERVNAQTPPQR